MLNTEDEYRGRGVFQQSTEGHSDVPIEHRAPTGYKGHRNVKAEYKGHRCPCGAQGTQGHLCMNRSSYWY